MLPYTATHCSHGYTYARPKHHYIIAPPSPPHKNTVPMQLHMAAKNNQRQWYEMKGIKYESYQITQTIKRKQLPLKRIGWKKKKLKDRKVPGLVLETLSSCCLILWYLKIPDPVKFITRWIGTSAFRIGQRNLDMFTPRWRAAVIGRERSATPSTWRRVSCAAHAQKNSEIFSVCPQFHAKKGKQLCLSDWQMKYFLFGFHNVCT